MSYLGKSKCWYSNNCLHYKVCCSLIFVLCTWCLITLFSWTWSNFIKINFEKNYPLLLKHNGGALGKINVQLRNDLAYLKMG